MIKRIAITGPESTGKTWLTESLATYFNTTRVLEFAREYINKLSRPYTYDDIEIIAKQQLQQEEAFAAIATNFLFIDTDFFVTKIWSEYVYHKCSPWIIDQLENHNYDLHLLCNIDLPWEYDPQREHPNNRIELFDLYHSELTKSGKPFIIISGKDETRLQCALDGIFQKFK
ncbi:MAG: ATP-binding protein [Bacteroidota bacterium]